MRQIVHSGHLPSVPAAVQEYLEEHYAEIFSVIGATYPGTHLSALFGARIYVASNNTEDLAMIIGDTDKGLRCIAEGSVTFDLYEKFPGWVLVGIEFPGKMLFFIPDSMLDKAKYYTKEQREYINNFCDSLQASEEALGK